MGRKLCKAACPICQISISREWFRSSTPFQRQQIELNDQGKAFPIVSSRFLGQKRGGEGGRSVTHENSAPGAPMEKTIRMCILVIPPSG